jgi:ribonuclease D
MTISYHKGDLPAGLDFGTSIAIDSETMGLRLQRDRLCVVQLSAGDGTVHVVHFPDRDYAAPNLRKVLSDPKITKIFHFARFDLAMIERYFGIVCRPVYCTRTASKLVRTNTERHGLKDLCAELLGVELSKQQQTSDWGAETLNQQQLDYAAADLAQACFDFLPHRASLDLAGWEEEDIFAH